MPVSKPLLIAGTGVYVVGASAAYVLLKPPGDPQQQAATFDGLARHYDAKVNFEETFMGLKLLRWWLVSQAKGDVLEISAGTGRNLGYYKWKALTSLTVTDASRHMLFYAREKLDTSKHDVPVHFVEADAQRLCSHGSVLAASESTASTSQHSQQLPQQRFDTVIDIFGLCSHSSPVDALKEASRMCKPGGRILLLEHGKAKYGWLNSILDRDAENHKRQWACEWNKDIEAIVRAAGLTVESQQRYHFGTTFVIVARPAAAVSAL